MTNKETAFIYCRVSTEKQDTERQLRELRTFAETNNLNIIEVYEETLSGTKSIAARNELLQKVNRLKPKYFIIHDYSRFSRNVKTALQMKDELHSMNVCLWSMQTNMKSLDDDGTPNLVANLVFTQLLAVYEMENEQRRIHIKSGLRNAKAKGIVLGRPKGATINRLEKYKSIVRTIKEQEELKMQGKKYLSVRKTAAYFDKEKSLIQAIRDDMKKEGMIQESFRTDCRNPNAPIMPDLAR